MDTIPPVAVEWIGVGIAADRGSDDLAQIEAQIPQLITLSAGRRHTVAPAPRTPHQGAPCAETSGIAIAREHHEPSMIDPYVSSIADTLTRYPTLRAGRLYQVARERG